VEEKLIKARNYLINNMYRWIVKPIFFLFDPEDTHDFVIIWGRLLGRYGATRYFTSLFFNYSHPSLRQNVLGINFSNPIGLSAGFDKNATLIDIMPSVGFGFTEIGSITRKPYDGNQRPRLYRLPEHQSLRVNYGLKNLGAEILHNKLQNKVWDLPVCINIAKTNSPETSEVNKGIEDYFFTYKIFQDTGSFFTINISCPNTCEEKPVFAEPQNLDLLLKKIFSIPKNKPVFIKISPDLPEAQLNSILEVCKKYDVDGFVCTNLTKVNLWNHTGKGGFSGKVVDGLSTEMIRRVYKFYAGKKIIIGSGGIFNADDAYEKIKAGATLLELITGMIYGGPQVISEINQGLVTLLQRDGYRNISEAVGKE